MSKTNCGTFQVDEKTLFWVDNCLTTSEKKPTSIEKLPCKMISYDTSVFKLLDGVLTDVNASAVGEVIDLCGELLLDTGVFLKKDNIFSFDSADVTVSSVSITAAGDATEVAKGETLQFTASVVGTNNPAQTVTWSLVEEVAEGTSVSDAGLLKVATAETVESITVKAVSTVDETKAGTLEVTVVEA